MFCPDSLEFSGYIQKFLIWIGSILLHVWGTTYYCVSVLPWILKGDVVVLCAYTLIAFDKRVVFWLQHVRSLRCVCAYAALFVRRLALNLYTTPVNRTHIQCSKRAHTQGSDQAYWRQKVNLSSKAIGVKSLPIILTMLLPIYIRSLVRRFLQGPKVECMNTTNIKHVTIFRPVFRLLKDLNVSHLVLWLISGCWDTL